MIHQKLGSRRPRIEPLESRRLFAIDPTGDEQEMLQLINRFRTDPTGEFDRLFSSASPLKARDGSMQADLDFFKVDGNLLRSEFAALSPVMPVTWNEAITNFTANHNNNMIAQNLLFHTDTLARRAALIAAGVKLDTTSGQRINSEIVFGQIRSPIHAYAAYAVNWGTGTGGMETARSHREALINSVFEEIGGKLTDTTASNLKPRVNSFILANIADAAVRVSGAVFEDRNGSRWYESGEGFGRVSLRFEHTDGRVFTTTAFGAGGYQIDLPAGTYKVRVSGGSMQHAVTRTLTVADKSLWENFIYAASDPTPDVNEPNDSTVTATRLGSPSGSQSGLSLHAASDVDYFVYTAVGTGIASYELQFNQAAGNLDLQLLNSAGQVLATSNSATNSESIQFQTEAGSTYFLRVFGAANDNYLIRVTGPEAISPDSSEPNDTTASATALSGSSPTLANLNLHSNQDIDLYRYDAIANGSAVVRLSFDHAQGNIDLQFLDAAANVIATSATSANQETVTVTVERGKSYFIKAYGGPNKSYTLAVTGPTLQAPISNRDQAVVTSDAPTATISILANDTDPDGSFANLTPTFVGSPASFTLNSDKTVTVLAPADFGGLLRAIYQVTDNDGLQSSPTNIDVMVVDYRRVHPWQNPINPLDTNGDGVLSPSDALIVINYWNSGQSRLLPTSGSTKIYGFLDVNGDGIVSPSDAIQIINQLNAKHGGEGEATFRQVAQSPSTSSHDVALAQLYDSDTLSPGKKNRRA